MPKICANCGKDIWFFDKYTMKYGVAPICKECDIKENSEEWITFWRNKSTSELIALLGDYEINNRRNATQYLGEKKR